MNRFTGLLTVFEQAASNTSIGITGKRRKLVIEALRIAAATEEATMSNEVTKTAGVPVVLAFNHQRIADIVTIAVETPVGDWFRRAVPPQHLRELAQQVRKTGPWYALGATYQLPGFQMIVTVENPVNDGKGDVIDKCLTMEDFQRALVLMATKDDGAYSHHFADFLRDNEDANTADLFMQFAVYGEEVYA